MSRIRIMKLLCRCRPLVNLHFVSASTCHCIPDLLSKSRLMLIHLDDVRPMKRHSVWHFNDRSLVLILCSAYSTSSGSGNDKSVSSKTHSVGSSETIQSGKSDASVGHAIRGSTVAGQQGAPKAETKRIIKVVPTSTKISEVSVDKHNDETRKSTKLISALRAINEYCLNERHLESLPKIKRRSAYFGELPTVMYTEADVERLAIQVHGSKAKQRRLSYKASLMLQSKSLYNEEILPHPSTSFKSKERVSDSEQSELFHGSGLVVLSAIGVNALNAALKFGMWCYTGSHSIFAECVHSLADTLNQIVLAVGIHQSIKKPDPLHPYGYSNLRHVTSLISGVGIFFLGTGLSLYHGIHGLIEPQPIQPIFWTYALLSISFVSEAGTLLYAYDQIRKKAKAHKLTVNEFVWQSHEPGLNVVLLEDCASVLGVSIAAFSVGLSQYLNSHVPDAIGSIVIGSLLGVVASFIIYTNSVHLVGKSMPQDEIIEIVSELETDPVVRSVQDVKTTELGGEQIRFKAEVDLDGYQMTKAYLKTQDMAKLLEEVKRLETSNDLEKFMTFHGEQIVDRVGAEIDRIEYALKHKHPDLRHVDLEVL